METTKIVEILRQIDINLLLKQNTLKAVLADLLYEYEAEKKILNTIHNSVNVVEKLYKSNNKLLECQSIKAELLSYGLNDTTVDWALGIWSGVLGINIRDIKESINQSTKISAGGSFTVALVEEKTVYAWGNNKWGQLGNGSINDCIRPVDITDGFNIRNGEEVVDIFTSFRSAYLLTTEGRLFSWGNNDHGQLGDGTNIDKSYPKEITSRFCLLDGEKILNVNTGGFHCLLITSFGRFFSWGNNEYGQLGDGSNINKNIPVDITSEFLLKNDEKLENVYVGLGHSMLTTSLGRIYSWGNNEYGQLGDGTTTKKNKPTDITSDFNFMDNEKVHNVSIGSLHSLIVTTNGRIFAFGNNDSGQLGDATTKVRFKPVDITSHFNAEPDEKIVLIKAGRNHSLALTSLGKVFSWGNNKNGQLGIAGYITGTTGPMDITSNIINDDEYIVNIYTGANSTHSYAIDSNNKVYAWGNNEYGQLGEGSTVEKRSPIEIKIVK